jgi:hypothetical protein
MGPAGMKFRREFLQGFRAPLLRYFIDAIALAATAALAATSAAAPTLPISASAAISGLRFCWLSRLSWPEQLSDLATDHLGHNPHVGWRIEHKLKVMDMLLLLDEYVLDVDAKGIFFDEVDELLVHIHRFFLEVHLKLNYILDGGTSW